MTTADTAAPRRFNFKRFMADQLRNIAPVFTLVALVVFFSFASDSFLSLDNALNIIRQQPRYQKADVLMISDGDCQLSEAFTAQLQAQKQPLECCIYSVLCAGSRVEDSFSDEVVVL